MNINGVVIDDTFSEAFSMRATRIVITAINYKWARHAAETMTGFATSVIGCRVEAGIEKQLTHSETPDGRPGISVLLFSTDRKTLQAQLETRIGQCVLTCPTTAVFAGLYTEDRIGLGKNLRYFGDGYQSSKLIGAERYWRIPVMDGEFICQETTGVQKAIGGGNLLVFARSISQVLLACEAAIDSMTALPNVILPFPGGGVRSGSKVGSKYPALSASTNHRYCPTLKGRDDSVLDKNIEAVMEIVIDGLTTEDVALAMKVGIEAICDLGKSQGIEKITGGNYGGKLGEHHFHLREIVGE
ncbi:MAG: formylmethanofuran--tetrahydromethanopterin N-formyltransferase [Gammaproteobacteria bacterium TMED119]|nr:MAG: formylmethanofuran--tetrahydromethanopterin N-formyltransferase [Gammaproteobacteria bacterium TMED119]RCL45265.1 MAG: formylmethanofuran--tetrahydromethanopterin N-formyltransferase [Candidatus Thioglobus sp.]|tara:strand:+ start:1188 stop:2087 length:900 start_codon:yes stop_codon:yes gene_type:complete